MPRVAKLLALAGLFAAGALLAGTIGVRAADTTTTDTTALTATTDATATTDTSATTAAPPTTTVIATTTVQQTTTRILPLPAGTTTSSTEEGTPAWVWVLLAILAVGLMVLIVLLARRGGGGGKVPVEERRARLDAALGSWTAQGWAIENDTGDSAVLRRGAEAMLVGVDEAGHVSTRPLPTAGAGPG